MSNNEAASDGESDKNNKEIQNSMKKTINSNSEFWLKNKIK